ncbi:hypothetical protein C8J57DRAFT_1499366 [Mycena rebaudengoi]|nr:hypothetical protein C8J57DRAFT_1499366 [Mycena rebaudengoi]
MGPIDSISKSKPTVTPRSVASDIPLDKLRVSADQHAALEKIDSDMPQVVDGALKVLSHIPQMKFPLVTTGVSVEAKLLDRLSNMLGAPNTPEWRYPVIFQILSHMVLHESSAVAVVEANILNSTAKVLKFLPANLHPPIYLMLERLMSHASTATAVLDMPLYDLLATLWRENPDDCPLTHSVTAINLLANIVRWQEGAEGVVIAKLLNCILYGLHSDNPWLRLYTCKLLHTLVGHESTVQAVVVAVPRKDIVALLTDRNPGVWDVSVRQCAAEIL